MAKPLIPPEPAHQMFQVGDLVLFSHDYDGDVLQLVRYKHPKEGDQIAIRAQDLYDVLAKMLDERLAAG